MGDKTRARCQGPLGEEAGADLPELSGDICKPR
jgi:hypothetical protein